MTDLQTKLQASLGDAYRIERELGGGGMSRVYLAEETALGRKVVIKVLPPEMAAGVSVDRFRREIQLAASLQHPHIVPLHTAGSADGVFYYTMPMVEGESLRARLTREGELPVGEVIRILRDVADALAHAHAHDVVHRDIKPDNVLISGHHAMVTDFGVAKAVSESTGAGAITSMGVALGTPAYMAPEQAMAEPNIDHRADIYALGVLAYEMLTGRTPFAAPTAQALLAAQVTQVPAPVTKHRASVPAALAELVMRCLEKKPADRWQRADELHRALDAMATPSGGTTPTETRPVTGVRAPAALRRYAIPAVAVVAVAVLALLLGRFTRSDGGGATVDANVLAVLPFRVAGADPSLHYLREGMIDLLAAKFTGEGGPRAADPRTVTSAWRRAVSAETDDLSQQAAIDLAAGLGAGQILLGGIVGSPGRVVMNATLLGVPAGDTRAQVTVEGPADNLPGLINELTGLLLVRGMGMAQQTEASLTTTSIDALKAYLAGQAAYRRGNYAEAAGQLERATQIDSTFALAAFALRVTLGWQQGLGDVARAGRLAWAGRDRMSRRDRALMEAYLGPDFPRVSTAADLVAARERAVELVPDHPDAWYFLGDQYFHQGEYLGYRDWIARSEAAFHRALALDSTFAGPVAHMVDLAAERADPAMGRRFGALFLSTDGRTAGGYSILVRWRLARLLGDSALIREARTSFDTMPSRPSYFAGAALWFGASASEAEELTTMLARRASTQAERTAYSYFRMMSLASRGRPQQALALADSVFRIAGNEVEGAEHHMWLALYGVADTSAGRAAAVTLTPLAAAPVAGDVGQRWRQSTAACMVGQWDVARGALDRVPRYIERLRAVVPGRDSATTVSTAATCAAVLEAMLAVARNSANARAIVDRADSVMRRGPWADGPIFHNLAIARLYARLGAPDRALAAVRRRGWFGGASAMYLREEARLAAEVGERDAAVRAYSDLLRFWADPEPGVRPLVDEVKAELARLVGERG